MKLLSRAKSGQTILPEYVVTFFLVIGVVVAMSAYIQRGLQARIHDAKNYAIVMANQACDSNCHNATGAASGQDLLYEYEPYYGQTSSVTSRQRTDHTALLATGHEGTSRKIINEENSSTTASVQLPPRAAVSDERGQ